MATVTTESIGNLHEKISVKLERQDYLPSFEKALKENSKKANIPGFRKGMVPSGLIKKMYGPSLFTDEVLRSVDRELVAYLQNGKVEIFAQPLPLDTDVAQLDVNNPADYTFHFEVGKKPEFDLPAFGSLPVTKYVVDVTDEMITDEIARLQNRYGNVSDMDTVSGEDSILNVVFTEVNENADEVAGGITKDNSILLKYFRPGFQGNLEGKTVNDYVVAKLEDAFEGTQLDTILEDLGLSKEDVAARQKTFRIQLTKVGKMDKKELNEEFFSQLYPGGEVKTEADFRNKVRDEISAHWNNQARNQIHDQLFHLLTEQTQIQFPEEFLRKWMATQGESPKTPEEVESEFPGFLNSLKWTLITDKIVNENQIEVTPDEVKDFARQQLFGYMGNMGQVADDQPWVNEYIDKMMKDRKYVEDAYTRLQTQKIFEFAESKVSPAEQTMAADDFNKMVQEHQHHHHA